MVNPQGIHTGKLYKWTCDQPIINAWSEIGHTEGASQVFGCQYKYKIIQLSKF